MPSGLIKIRDAAITRGMNTVDDPKRLREGECVRLLNMFPGNPVRPRNGCTGKLLPTSTSYRFVPPGIAFDSGSCVYAVIWVNDKNNDTQYHLLAIRSDLSGTYTDLGTMEFISTARMFDFLKAHACVYCAVAPAMSKWKSSTDALGHKVLESNSIVRDMCIAQVGDKSSAVISSNSGVLNPAECYDYAVQYVRRNDANAFKSGATPSGMILPYGIAVNSEPQRIDTFLPGVCIGVEDDTKRFSFAIVARVCTPVAGASMLSQSGLGAYSEVQCVDADTATIGFNVDAATAGAYLKIDYTSGETRKVTSFDLYMSANSSTAVFKIQYSDNGTDWTDSVTSFIPALSGWNTQAVSESSPHRYWRLYLNNTPGAGPDIGEIRLYCKSSVSIDLSNSHAIAIAQGATHLRVSRSRSQSTTALAEAATKFFLCDLPIGVTTKVFLDTTSDATLSGETNQLITGYSEAPATSFIEYCKGRVFLMTQDGKVYYSEVAGGDGGTDMDLAIAYPQAWSSLFKPLEYYIDCDYVDGLKATGMRRLSDDVFFFKEKKIFGLFGGDPTATARSLVSERIGCVFPYTITQCELKLGNFGNVILFISNEGPMILSQGGKITPFSDFKIREFWPDLSRELFDELDDHYDWIIHNCSAAFFQNTWWVMYRTYGTDGTDGVNKCFGFFFDPNSSDDSGSSRGPLEIAFGSM